MGKRRLKRRSKIRRRRRRKMTNTPVHSQHDPEDL